MMTQILLLLNKCLNSQLVTSCALSLSLTVTQAALAEYNPPPDQRPPSGYTGTTGTRGGCKVSGGLPLTLLAPKKHVGQTASTHPTFAWFVPPDAKSFPMEFTLYEYGLDSKPKLAQKLELKSSPGIIKLSLPKDKPALAVGRRYLWQVLISCNPNHPSTDLVTRTEIEVVEMPPALKTALSATKDHLEMANLYARSGLWYDALSEALEPADDSRLKDVASNLLEDLAKLEEPKQSASLSQIASSKQMHGAANDDAKTSSRSE